MNRLRPWAASSPLTVQTDSHLQAYCTFFDRNYLVRGLALYLSLRRYCQPFELWVLCLDTSCYTELAKLRLPGVRLVALGELEREDPELSASRATRSLIEYYFTCTPCLPLHILRNCPGIDLITYLDSDLFFFADPSPIFEEIADRSIAVTEHRYPPYPSFLADYCSRTLGIYNVGWLSFRRDANGLACLGWWRERCLEWCHDRIEDGRFADQKYLDEWPARFSNLAVINHKGVNLAPWNLARYEISEAAGRVFVDESPLLVFHFHALKQIDEWTFHPSLDVYNLRPAETVVRNIYLPYIRALRSAHARYLRGGKTASETDGTDPGKPAFFQRMQTGWRRFRRLQCEHGELDTNRFISTADIRSLFLQNGCALPAGTPRVSEAPNGKC